MNSPAIKAKNSLWNFIFSPFEEKMVVTLPGTYKSAIERDFIKEIFVWTSILKRRDLHETTWAYNKVEWWHNLLMSWLLTASLACQQSGTNTKNHTDSSPSSFYCHSLSRWELWPSSHVSIRISIRTKQNKRQNKGMISSLRDKYRRKHKHKIIVQAYAKSRTREETRSCIFINSPEHNLLFSFDY